MINLFGSIKKLIVKKIVKKRIQKLELSDIGDLVKQVGNMYADIFKAMGAGVGAIEQTMHDNADEIAGIVADLAGPSEHAFNKGVEFFAALKELGDAYDKQPDVDAVMVELSTNCESAIEEHVKGSMDTRVKIMTEMGKNFAKTFIDNLDIPEEILEQKRDDLVKAGLMPDKKKPTEKKTTKKKATKKQAAKKRKDS